MMTSPTKNPGETLSRSARICRTSITAWSGMRLDEEKVIEVTYPDDFADEDLRGQTLPIWVKLLEINEKHVPELTDDWVKKTFVREPEEGAEPDPDAVETVEKLRATIREAMEQAAQDVADTEVRR